LKSETILETTNFMIVWFKTWYFELF
jgi:hypothetical protein